jgi:hypothetical protein
VQSTRHACGRRPAHFRQEVGEVTVKRDLFFTSPKTLVRIDDPWDMRGGRMSELPSDFERECAGKLAYPSEATAEYLLKELMRQDKPRLRRESAGLQPYQCKFCQQWHLGH